MIVGEDEGGDDVEIAAHRLRVVLENELVRPGVEQDDSGLAADEGAEPPPRSQTLVCSVLIQNTDLGHATTTEGAYPIRAGACQREAHDSGVPMQSHRAKAPGQIPIPGVWSTTLKGCTRMGAQARRCVASESTAAAFEPAGRSYGMLYSPEPKGEDGYMLLRRSLRRNSVILALTVGVVIACGLPGCLGAVGTPDRPVVLLVTPCDGLEATRGVADLIADQLSDRTGLVVVPRVEPDYASTLAALCASEGDMVALLPPHLYVEAHDDTAGEVEVRLRGVRNGQSFYYASVYARRDLGIEGLRDLDGRPWMYNDPLSMSGYVIPYGGVFQPWNLDIGAVAPSGGHRDSLIAVMEGEVDFCTGYGFAPSAPEAWSGEAWRFGDDPELWIWDRWNEVPFRPAFRGACNDLRRSIADEYGLEEVLSAVGVVGNIGPLPNDGLALGPGFPESAATQLIDAVKALFEDGESATPWGEDTFYSWTGVTEVDDSDYDAYRELIEQMNLDESASGTAPSATGNVPPPSTPSAEEAPAGSEDASSEELAWESLPVDPSYTPESFTAYEWDGSSMVDWLELPIASSAHWEGWPVSEVRIGRSAEQVAIRWCFSHEPEEKPYNVRARFAGPDGLFFDVVVGLSPLVFSFSRDTDIAFGESHAGTRWWSMPDVTEEYAELVLADVEFYPGVWLRDVLGWSCVLSVEYSGPRGYHRLERYTFALRP